MGVPSFLACMAYDCFLHKIETEWAFPLFWLAWLMTVSYIR